MNKRTSVLFFLFLLGLSARSRDLRSDTLDIVSCRLQLDLTDFTGKIMQADATLGIKSKMNGVGAICVDLLRLTVDSVKVNTYHTAYSYNDTVLCINLLTTLNTGDSATVQIFYHGHPLQMPGDFGGFYWNATYAYNIGVSFLENPHNYGRVWFPCFDNFETRSYFEFWVTTKATQKAFCNGLLLDVVPHSQSTTWHWKLNQSIPSYLASVAVSDYQTLRDTLESDNRTIPVELAARSADTTALKNLFVHLHDAFHIQENLWGPYRWDRVGYCIIPFNAGAMEHATNIGFMQYYLSSLASQCETTMAHELSHHWFGDLVTCDSASEMWLNEGWASYNETLFLEHVYGMDSAQTYQRLNHENVLHKAHVNDGAYLPVNGVPTTQTYGSTVYEKGSDVIHTLRSYLGDQDFFNCMKNYLHDFSFTHASTQQLENYLQQCSGTDLTDFFEDWVNSPGFPHFSIEHWQTEAVDQTNMRTSFNIRQRLNHAPHFYQNVPVTVTYFDKQLTRYDEVVNVSGECTHHELVLPGFEPVFIALDFDEKLEDAITDEWRMVKDTGNYDFGTAKMVIHVSALHDSAIIRVEHNWIPADAMKNPIPGLHLHNYRYWTVDGTFDAALQAEATLSYDGTPGAYLDHTFMTQSEDSLVIMYRPDQTYDWTLADSFYIDTKGNATDKMGAVTIKGLRKGEYALAIWDATRPTETDTRISCAVQTDIQSPHLTAYTVFPNPSNNEVAVRFAANVFETATISDIHGHRLWQQNIPPGRQLLNVSLRHFSSGIYLITLTNSYKESFTKKIVKE